MSDRFFLCHIDVLVMKAKLEKKKKKKKKKKRGLPRIPPAKHDVTFMFTLIFSWF